LVARFAAKGPAAPKACRFCGVVQKIEQANGQAEKHQDETAGGFVHGFIYLFSVVDMV
jgi:hypothetical protein